MEKALKIIKPVLIWVIAVIAACMAVFTVVASSTFNRADRTLFGCQALVGQANSEFSADDVVLIKKVDLSTLKAGDIIAYRSVSAEHYGQTVIHTIRELTTDAGGAAGFVTYSAATGVDDTSVVSYDLVFGAYQSRLAGVGGFFRFLKTVPGYLLCIFLPFVILILVQGTGIVRLYRQHWESQPEEEPEEELADIETPMLEFKWVKAQVKIDIDGEDPPKPDSSDHSGLDLKF